MIRLKPSLVQGLDGTPDVTAVRKALQSAVELEHATIPLYLYALYSLDEARNAAICDIIQSIVVEEMLHMILVCNVLNAIGGSPVIDRPGFIPTYPGPLPGGVESELRVQLAPFSKTVPSGHSQLDCFIQIEEPEDPLNFKNLLVAEEEITIGQFYTRISHSIGALGNGAFVDPPRHQVGPDLMHESVVVTNVATAQQALKTIIEQGEGTHLLPLEVVGTGYAHYYRFEEIKRGHQLVKVDRGPKPEDKYSYTGAAVPFDPAGVYEVPTDPSASHYSPGSPQAFANNNFNYTYTALMKVLHTMVNGDSTTAVFSRALGLMMSLKNQGRAMMSGIPNPALMIGPSFEYLPVNPSVSAGTV